MNDKTPAPALGELVIIQTDIERRIAEAVAQEREACAKLLDPAYPHLAAAIRARGDK